MQNLMDERVLEGGLRHAFKKLDGRRLLVVYSVGRVVVLGQVVDENNVNVGR